MPGKKALPRFSRIVRRAAARGSRARPSREVETLDAVAMLMRQHRSIARRLAALAVDADGPHTRAQHRTLLELADALAIHIALGERHFYPALRGPTGQAAPPVRTRHRTLRALLGDVLRVAHGPGGFGAAVTALAEAFARHVADEERCVFPFARTRLAPALDAVGQEMMATMIRLEEGAPRDEVLRVGQRHSQAER